MIAQKEFFAAFLAGRTVHVKGAAIWENDGNGNRVEVGSRDYSYRNPSIETPKPSDEEKSLDRK